MSTIDWIKKEGLGNYYQGKDSLYTVIDLPVAKYNYFAHCTSAKCCGINEYGSVIIKDVPRSAVDCPACRCVLFWEKIKID